MLNSKVVDDISAEDKGDKCILQTIEIVPDNVLTSAKKATSETPSKKADSTNEEEEDGSKSPKRRKSVKG